MYQRYILCSNELFIQSKHSARSVPPPYSNLINATYLSSLSLPSILCHFCGTKPSIKPLTTDRFKKPSSFSFVRVFSALYRKNQSRNSYRFLDLAARKLHAHRQTDRQTHTHSVIIIEIFRSIAFFQRLLSNMVELPLFSINRFFLAIG